MDRIGLIGLPEVGYIVGITVIIIGITAVRQNPFLSKGQKALWILTILVLNWIGLLWYYYVYYIKAVVVLLCILYKGEMTGI